MADEKEKWLCGELAKLGLDEEIRRYIFSIDDICDRRDCIVEFIETESKKKHFLKEWQLHYVNVSSSHNVQVYQKQRFDNDSPKKIKEKSELLPVSVKSNSTYSNFNQEKPETNFSLQNGLSSNQFRSTSAEIGIGAKKKTKFVSLYSKEGQAKTVIQLPGRHVCECQAAKHKLINNCINCGRIVCEQEGAGPCVFCGSLVCTPEDQEIIDRGSKKGMKLSKWLMKNSGNPATNQDESNQSAIDTVIYKEGFDQALQHRNKLLEYDKNSVRRTQVIDDECDYFATESNQWLNEEEKKKLRKQEETFRQARHGSKRDRKITFDFAGRRIIDAEDDVAKKMYAVQNSAVQEVYSFQSNDKKSREELYCPPFHKPVYEEVYAPSEQRNTKTTKSLTSSRIQDKELQEMSDLGLCLSMHQPWASLLVAGIKKDEGRTWYTAHRGRLWIASTVKTPSADEIREMENLYYHLYKGQTLQFPKNYSTGSLLGCVNIEDCLSQEEYKKKQYPDGESNSPFVFICTNPQELLIKFPIKGKHKIYKLDQNVHQAAKKGLR